MTIVMIGLLILFYVALVAVGTLFVRTIWNSGAKCPHCRAHVYKGATVCASCTREIPLVTK